MSAPHPLYRNEVLEQRHDRLPGEISLAIPFSWQAIGFLLLAALVATVGFLSVASYERVEIAPGEIVLDRGVAPVLPSRPGVIVGVAVRPGARVAGGQILGRIRIEEGRQGGSTVPQDVMKALALQDERLGRQEALMDSAAMAERERVEARISGLAQEIGSLDSQIAAQRRIIALAQADLRRLQGATSQGFISRRDLETRESALLAREQQLAQLEQSKAAKHADLAEARRTILQLANAAAAESAGVRSNRAALAARRAEAAGGEGYDIVAPVAGTVTAVSGKAGQPARTDHPLMIIVPDGASPRAELHVPSSAIGFIRVGQEVRLSVDAFPYERFGTISARVADVALAPVSRQAADSRTEHVYLVTAEVPQPWVMAFGRRHPLLPGMTFSARIVAERQSLMRWLLDPLLAVSRR